MRLDQSKVLSRFFVPASQGNYDFYRCVDCKRVFSRDRELSVYAMSADDGIVSMCGCGSMRFKPTWPVVTEWILPGVVKYTLKLVLVRGLAPWISSTFPDALPLIEWIVRLPHEDPTRWHSTL